MRFGMVEKRSRSPHFRRDDPDDKLGLRLFMVRLGSPR